MSPNRSGRAGGFGPRWAVLALAAAAAAGCGVDTSSSVGGPISAGPVVVGASDSVESELVARLYAGSLDAHGRSTELLLGLGDRADRLAALDADRVALVPDYTGRLLHWFDPGAEVTAADDVYEALNKSLPPGLAVSDYAPADDRSSLVLGAARAGSSGPGTVGDLAPDCATSTLYSTPEFAEDRNALSRLASVYGCTFAAVVPVPDAAAMSGELAGTAAVGGTTAAAPAVRADELAVLGDEDDAFTAQNVVPLYRGEALTSDDVKALSVVMQLTTSDLTGMAARIRAGEISSADAANEWLDEHL
ncbi:ABC transporter substrate-binding protein [Rhodococcus sp. SGAir0479]|uniref:ABC transporter substrate-binding protein n=1 Tax=Rhodococcus sp. SGAir0479 TaxID=2567884 RepID=UPI0010CD31EA|nr:ABC transporter substrate-binding protein [Rhodococcus sp. SGAir0479]QCQ90332.1 ABC transporter substrate-binding protein [Rhodococcus sp. SGAir0479]